MYSRIRSAVCVGIEGRDVCVETDISRGLPGIGVSGLPSVMVMESRERIKSAIINSGFDFPKGRITVNLTPASLRKNTSGLDLPMAIGILAGGGCLEKKVSPEWGIIGELSLDGRVLGVGSALPMMLHMKDMGLKGIIVPEANRCEAVLAGGNIFTVRSLMECVLLVTQDPREIRSYIEYGDDTDGFGGYDKAAAPANMVRKKGRDFADIVGQEGAKRAVVIAAAGRHGLLMVGSPGCGKTMIAGRMADVMPEMNEREKLETAIVRSVAGCGHEIIRYKNLRPFREPHHTIGRAGLIGGGSYPVPGEITLAHNGVLFLDEICEFRKEVIEAMRIPMEEKKITHFRKGEAFTFPCNFQVVMATNPCPCGYLGDRDKQCSCTTQEIDKYRKKLSGPIMDRIDMNITMDKVEYEELTGEKSGMTTAEMRTQVEDAIAFARKRGQKAFNSELGESEIEQYCKLGREEKEFMSMAYKSLAMSPRAYNRAVKVARTIADLAQSADIKKEHLAEALNYRIREQ